MIAAARLRALRPGAHADHDTPVTLPAPQYGGAAMRRTLVRDVAARAGEIVRICGWATVRAGGGLGVSDHTGEAAVVAERVPEVAPGSALEVTGTVVDTDPGQPCIDLGDTGEVRVVGPALGPLPVDESAPLGARLDWRYVDLRRPRNRLIFEVQTTAERAMRAWWAEHGFIEIHSPKLRSMPNQSGRELFTMDYFGRPAYLAQSPQFSKQMAMCAGFDRVFEIGPVFRANPLHTSRHDTEFTSVDVEVSWIDSHDDLMAMEEVWLQQVIAAVEEAHADQVRRHFGKEIRVPEVPFPRMTMAEAHDLLGTPMGDLDAGEERRLGDHVASAHDHDFLFVTAYPESVRPFYHMRLEEGSGLTRSFDLLWNGLEVTTGAQREHRYERLVAQANRNPSRVEVIRTYLDFFRYGCPPHGGFGLGLTRMLMCLLGADDVREVTFVPRDSRRLAP